MGDEDRRRQSPSIDSEVNLPISPLRVRASYSPSTARASTSLRTLVARKDIDPAHLITDQVLDADTPKAHTTPGCYGAF
jgi:hypothetical protein